MRYGQSATGMVLGLILLTAGASACGQNQDHRLSSTWGPVGTAPDEPDPAPEPTGSPDPAPGPEPTASPSPAPTSTPPPDVEVTLQQQVLNLTNQYRADAGVAPLTMNSQLMAAAQGFAELMVLEGFFGHTSPDGSSAGDRIRAVGYDWRTWGENIAYGYSTPAAVMNAWMNSSGHQANILNSKFMELGVGIFIKQTSSGGSGAVYWVQNFGAR